MQCHASTELGGKKLRELLKNPNVTADKDIRDGTDSRLAEIMGASLSSSPEHYPPGGARPLTALILCMTLGVLCSLSTGWAQTIKATGERKVISRVEVTYPKLAQQMRLRGTVKVSATVAPTGKVLKTDLIGGSPVFVPYALNAVSLLKWEPGPKQTTEIVEVDFVPGLRQ